MLRAPRAMPEPFFAIFERTRRSPSELPVRTGSSGLAPGLGLPGCVAEGPNEAVAIALEFGHSPFDAASDFVDRHEEGHLAVAQGIQNLAVAAADLEDALAVGHEFDFGQVLIETGLVVQIVPGPAYSLKRHSSVEQGLDHFEGDEVAKSVEPRDAGPASRGLNGRDHQSDAVPISQLARRTASEL